ncbi:unnamed protein product [Rotaria socialis]|uniref:Uncharacterized protein n=2 Tax=Rotaria socialis TaxID=392032 RepID=A0A821GPU1_9BILA|nr:unnamed protein product [Rotaria socialis]CAF4374043.1 unnamed protein product [Rotaria socialis]CAF4484623.1 unnamed protein product [Rotaria socialis]CAF4672783.1 unnamed protein product [Rotaria socialis]
MFKEEKKKWRPSMASYKGRFEMSDFILSKILLYECLSYGLSGSQEKIRTTDVTDRSKFLSSFVFFLNGSATCTAVYVSEADHVIFIARNEPITATDEQPSLTYMSSIKDKAIEEARDQLDSIIFEYNSKKIINYFAGRNSKVIHGLIKMVRWNTHEKYHFIEELQSNKEYYRNYPLMTDKIFLISKNDTEEDYMKFLLRSLNEFLVARDQIFGN